MFRTLQELPLKNGLDQDYDKVNLEKQRDRSKMLPIIVRTHAIRVSSLDGNIRKFYVFG